jgi:hypothetical protein
MADDAANGKAEVPHSGVVSLRRELWRKHVQLRDIGPDDLRYADAANEALELTARLLAAEEAVTSAARSAHRRASIALYGLAVGASAALIGMVALLPGLGTVIARAAIGTVLVLIVLIGTVLVRWRHTRGPRRASATATEQVPAIDPITHPTPARSSS